MKSFLAVVVVLAVFASIEAALDRAQSLALAKKCAMKTGAKENPEELLDKQLIPETREGKCMFACVLKEKGLMKNGKVDGKAISDFFEKTYSDDPEKLEQAAAAVGKCSTLDVSGKDECEVAVAYAKCGKAEGFRLE
ncbi:general odorant-binding protein 28a-like [Macrosteles quadrilineatus]|uniref:general odorant-binding protein 28a-like n=1 Tax=Macrosteles quadrilineatus TaxID=74068 RepID=UPI0023E33249|nr:general odorant-binding protein 28a-like [Macrosteles quadrilineatus]